MHRKLAVFPLIAVLIFTAACDKNKLRRAREASHQIETLVGSGTDTIVAFERDNVINHDSEIALARILLQINEGNAVLLRTVTDSTVWDGNTRGSVIVQLDTIAQAVQRLADAGLLHIHNPASLDKFRGLISTLRAALALIQNEVD